MKKHNCVDAKAATTMPPKLRKRLKNLQREVGSKAFGMPHSAIAVGYIDAELGWSAFEAREVNSKLFYTARINGISETKWPKAIRKMIRIANGPAKLQKRSENLKKSFGYEVIREIPRKTIRFSLAVYRKLVDETIKKKLDEDWRDGTSKKELLTGTEPIKQFGKLSNTYTTVLETVTCWQMLEWNVHRPENTRPNTRTSKRLAPYAAQKEKL